MNNYVDLNGTIAFIYNGSTFERSSQHGWCSVKTCVDAAVNSVIQRKGQILDEKVLKILATQIMDKLKSQIV